MPTLNKKLLLRLLILLILSAGSLFGVHYAQSQNVADALLWQAENATEKGNLDKAILYARQYLEKRPSDHDTAMKLGELILKRQTTANSLASVMFLWEKILREAPQRDDVREKLLDICVKLGRWSDALTHAEVLLKRNPSDGYLLEKVAICRNAQNQGEKARESLQKAIESTPQNVRAWEMLAQYQLKQNQSDVARATLDRMIESNPKSADAFLVRSRWFKTRSENDEALKDLATVLELDPENAEAMLITAEIQQTRGEIHKARKLLTAGMTRYPQDARMYRALSWMEISLNNATAAASILEEGIARIPGDPELLTPLADLLIQQGESEKVKAIIQKLQSRKAPRSSIEYLNARLLMKQNRWKDAAELFEKLRSDTVVLPAFSAQLSFLQSVCYEHLGNPESQIDALQRVLNADSTHSAARITLGNLYLNAGKWDESIKEFAIAAKAPFATIPTQLTLLRLKIAQARMNNVKPEIWKDLTSSVEEFRLRYPTAVEPITLMAELLVSANDPAGAIQWLRKYVGEKLNDPRIWVALVTIAEQAEGLPSALDTLDEARNLLGDTVDLRLVRAQLWAGDIRGKRADRVRELETGLEEYSDADQIRFLFGMADLYFTSNQPEGLVRVYRQLATRLPRDLNVRRMLFEAALLTRDEAVLTQVRQEIRQISPERNPLLLPETLAKIADLPAGDVTLLQAKELAESTLRATPDSADAHLVLGRVAEKSGDNRSAKRHLQLAADFDRTSLRNLQSLLSFQLRTDEVATAQASLARFYYDIRVTPRRFLALLEGSTRDIPEPVFVKTINSLAAHLAREPQSLLWTADLLARRNRAGDSLKLARMAVSLFPASADAWSALIQQLPATEAPEPSLLKAREVLKPGKYWQVVAESIDALRLTRTDWKPALLSPEDRRAFTQAVFNTRLGRAQEGAAALLLDQFLADPATPAADITWARRNRDLLGVIRGTPAERKQFAENLRAQKPSPLDSIEDLRARVATSTLATRHLTGAEKKAAVNECINLFTAITARPEATAKDWWGLAQFHVFAGNRLEYEKCLLQLMAKDPKNLFYVVAWAEELMQQNRVEEVAPAIARLSPAKQDLRAVTTIARWHALKNDASKAIAVLDEFVQSVDANLPEARQRTRQATEALDTLARQAAGRKIPSARLLTDAALERYRVVVRNYPEAITSLVALMGFDSQTARAFETLTLFKEQLGPKALAEAGMAVLRSGNATEKHFATVRGWLENLRKEMPDSLHPLLSLAELNTLEHNYAAAEDAYRKVLNRDPKNVIALNNLAWILSPRPESSEAAMKLIDEAIRGNGTMGELLDTRSRIYLASGQTEKALADLNEALSQSKTSLRYFHLAVVQLKQQNRPEAMKTFREAQARGLDPKLIHPSDLPMYRVLNDVSGQ